MSRLDRNALRLDVSAARGAWDDLQKLFLLVSSYTNALDHVDLSPVQVQGVAPIDLFHNLGSLRTALTNARNTASMWAQIGTPLYLESFGRIYQFGAELENAKTRINETVRIAANAKRALTEAERMAILASLRSLETSLNRSTADFGARRQALVDFTRAVTNDSTPLRYGAQDLDKGIAKLQDNVTQEALKYYLNPVTQGIGKLILELGTRILDRLRALKATLDPVAQMNDTVQRAMQGVLSIWSTTTEKYKTVIEVLSETQSSIDTFDLLPDLLDIAVLSWTDLREYIKRA